LEEALRALTKQTVQLAVAGNFTYRDILSMESRERQMHYEALVEIKKEEKDYHDKEMRNARSAHNFKMPSIPNINRFKK